MRQARTGAATRRALSSHACDVKACLEAPARDRRVLRCRAIPLLPASKRTPVYEGTGGIGVDQFRAVGRDGDYRNVWLSRTPGTWLTTYIAVQRAPGEGLRSRAANLVLMPALAPHPARAFGARHPLPAPRGEGEATHHFALRPGQLSDAFSTFGLSPTKRIFT